MSCILRSSIMSSYERSEPMTDCRSMLPDIWMVRSVEGEYIQSWPSSFSILVPFSAAGERYSVKDFFVPSDHVLAVMVRLVRLPLITICDSMMRFLDDIFR